MSDALKPQRILILSRKIHTKPKPNSTHFLVPTCILGGFTEPNRFPPETAAPVLAEILFGSVNPPKNTMGTKKCVEWGFVYGESEYEVSSGLVARSWELSPSVPEIPEPMDKYIFWLSRWGSYFFGLVHCTSGVPEVCGETPWEFQGGNFGFGKALRPWEILPSTLGNCGNRRGGLVKSVVKLK